MTQSTFGDSFSDIETDLYLTGQLLVAMPGIGDPRFGDLYLCPY